MERDESNLMVNVVLYNKNNANFKEYIIQQAALVICHVSNFQLILLLPKAYKNFPTMCDISLTCFD